MCYNSNAHQQRAPAQERAYHLSHRRSRESPKQTVHLLVWSRYEHTWRRHMSGWTCCGRHFVTLTKLRQHQDSDVCRDCRTREQEQPRGMPEQGPSEQGRWDITCMSNAARMRTVHKVPREAAQTMKQDFAGIVAQLKVDIRKRMERHLEISPDIDQALDEVFSVPPGLMKRDSEIDMLRQSPAYTKPVKRYLGTCPDSGEVFHCHDVPLDSSSRNRGPRCECKRLPRAASSARATHHVLVRPRRPEARQHCHDQSGHRILHLCRFGGLQRPRCPLHHC